MNDVETKVLEFINRNELIVPSQRVMLSLSAGKDSMALLHIMRTLCNKLSCTIEIFHLNHCARGDESDADEQFLVQLANHFAIPITIRRADVVATRPYGISFEEHARNVRYALLKEALMQRHCDVAVTAHTIDDAVETLIMRIFQGTGLFGLCGIDPKRDFVVRPLLCLTAEDVYRYLEIHRIAWREDSTNTDRRYLRNYVRHELLPVIRARFPLYREAINRLSEIVRDHCSMVESLVIHLYGEVFRFTHEGIIIELAKVGSNEMLLKHLVARAFHDLGVFMRKRSIEDIVQKLKTHKRNAVVFDGRGVIAQKACFENNEVLVICPKDFVPFNFNKWEYCIQLSALPVMIQLKEINIALELFWCDEEYFFEHRNDLLHGFIGLEGVKAAVKVRCWKAGDSILLAFGKKKVKKLFNEAKLTPFQKQSVPIIEIDGVIAAVLLGIVNKGVNRIAYDFLVKKSSKKILAIKRA